MHSDWLHINSTQRKIRDTNMANHLSLSSGIVCDLCFVNYNSCLFKIVCSEHELLLYQNMSYFFKKKNIAFHLPLFLELNLIKWCMKWHRDLLPNIFHKISVSAPRARNIAELTSSTTWVVLPGMLSCTSILVSSWAYKRSYPEVTGINIHVSQFWIRWRNFSHFRGGIFLYICNCQLFYWMTQDPVQQQPALLSEFAEAVEGRGKDTDSGDRVWTSVVDLSTLSLCLSSLMCKTGMIIMISTI